jgi:hypothetical protein
MRLRVDRKFLLQAASVVIIIGMAGSYPLLVFGSREVAIAALIGCLMSVLNALVGSITLEYALDKSYSTFFGVVIGGMGIRMVILLGTLYLLIAAFGIQKIALTVSLLGFYMIFLILEVLSIQRKVEVRNQGSLS